MTADDLPVPDEAIRVVRELTEDARGSTNDAAYVKAIAVPVVAAELRRMADEIEGMLMWQAEEYTVPQGIYAKMLRARADALCPREERTP